MKTRHLFPLFLALIAVMVMAVPAFAGGAGPVLVVENVWDDANPTVVDLSSVSDPVSGNILYAHGDLNGVGCEAYTYATADEFRASNPGPGTWKLWMATPEEVAGMVKDLGTCTLNFKPVTIPEPATTTTTTAPVTPTATVTSTETVTATAPVTATVPLTPTLAPAIPAMPDGMDAWAAFFQALFNFLGWNPMLPPTAPTAPAFTSTVTTTIDVPEINYLETVSRTVAITTACDGYVVTEQPLFLTDKPDAFLMEELGLMRWDKPDMVCWPDSLGVTQYVLAHGDIRGNGKSEVGIFNIADAKLIPGTARVFLLTADSIDGVDMALDFTQKWVSHATGADYKIVPHGRG